MIRIRDYEVEVDIAKELQQYDWDRPKWAGEKFLACSPFRNERKPSFAVRLDTGAWIDSGTDNEEWKKGNFVKLLSWLRNETYRETADYLLSKYYALNIIDTDLLKLNFEKLTLDVLKEEPLPDNLLMEYWFRSPYLEQKRGIEERIQRAFKIGYDQKHKAVTFPWFDKEGKLMNIKFRSVKDKRFWYFADGSPIRNHLYALNFIIKHEKKRVFIVESEIDALTLWQAKYPAIALGGANMSNRQRELILQSPIEEIVIATDNDKSGRIIAHSIVKQLTGFVKLEMLHFPDHVKDINEMLNEQFLKITDNPQEIKWLTLKMA